MRYYSLISHNNLGVHNNKTGKEYRVPTRANHRPEICQALTVTNKKISAFSSVTQGSLVKGSRYFRGTCSSISRGEEGLGRVEEV
jgi:hypothetical protein